MERGDKNKFDNGKLMWDLLPLSMVEPIVKVLTYGAKKYRPNSWQCVRHGRDRYYAAMLRHIRDWQSGEFYDPESGLPHLAHAACNMIFLLWLTRNDGPAVVVKQQSLVEDVLFKQEELPL